MNDWSLCGMRRIRISSQSKTKKNQYQILFVLKSKQKICRLNLYYAYWLQANQSKTRTGNGGKTKKRRWDMTVRMNESKTASGRKTTHTIRVVVVVRQKSKWWHFHCNTQNMQMFLHFSFVWTESFSFFHTGYF